MNVKAPSQDIIQVHILSEEQCIAANNPDFLNAHQNI